jgi:hypothetical protein
VRSLGPRPTDRALRAAWERRLRAIVAYRDGYGIAGPDPLGPTPTGRGQRLDHQRAGVATRRAQATVSDETRRRHGPAQQIDSGRDLSR